MKMIKYEGRASIDELLNDEYLQSGQKQKNNYENVKLKLGMFGLTKVQPKIIR